MPNWIDRLMGRPSEESVAASLAHLTSAVAANPVLSTARAAAAAAAPIQANRIQLDDDREAFDLMYADSLAGDPLYRPGPFWLDYERQYADWFRNHSFRESSDTSKRDGLAGGFITVESDPEFFAWGGSQVRFSMVDKPGYSALKRTLDGFLATAPSDPFLPYDLSVDALRRAAGRLTKYYGEARGARPIDALNWPLVGPAGDTFEFEGHVYTYRALYFYIKYAFASRHVSFDKIDRVVELGAGSGRQAVVMLNLHPHLTYVIFDIPTSLYFSHQYLKAIYGDRVVDYRDLRTVTSLDNLKSGKIYTFGSWQFPLLAGARIPLFWNCQSFQEMAPAAVANYTEIIEPTAERVYLAHSITGTTATSRGVALEEQMVLADDYGTKYLKGFDTVERSLSFDVLGDDLSQGGIDDIFLRRK